MGAFTRAHCVAYTPRTVEGGGVQRYKWTLAPLGSSLPTWHPRQTGKTDTYLHGSISGSQAMVGRVVQKAKSVRVLLGTLMSLEKSYVSARSTFTMCTHRHHKLILLKGKQMQLTVPARSTFTTYFNSHQGMHTLDAVHVSTYMQVPGA